MITQHHIFLLQTKSINIYVLYIYYIYNQQFYNSKIFSFFLQTMYQAILREFNKEGLSQQTQITQYQAKKALDSICAKNAGLPQFDNQVAHQIWNQTLDSNENGSKSIKLSQFINTMVKAQNILREQIQLTQEQLRTDLSLQNNPAKKAQLLNNLFSYSQDHRTITIPFGLQQVKQTKQIEESRLRNSIIPNRSILFTDNIDERQQSRDLKIALILTLVLLIIDLFVMFHKDHFFTLIGISLIICAYVLNYFEKNYVRFLLGWNLASALLDLLWLIVNTNNYWNSNKQNLHSNLQIGFLRFIVFMVCFEIIIKIILIGLMFKYHNIGQNIRKKVQIFGLAFYLDGKSDPQNLVARLFTKKQDIPQL